MVRKKKCSDPTFDETNIFARYENKNPIPLDDSSSDEDSSSVESNASVVDRILVEDTVNRSMEIEVTDQRLDRLEESMENKNPIPLDDSSSDEDSSSVESNASVVDRILVEDTVNRSMEIDVTDHSLDRLEESIYIDETIQHGQDPSPLPLKGRTRKTKYRLDNDSSDKMVPVPPKKLKIQPKEKPTKKVAPNKEIDLPRRSKRK